MTDSFEICRAASFEAAHCLPETMGGADEPERNTRLHGHSFAIEVCIAGEVGCDGRVISTDILSRALAEVTGRLDHRLLNDIIACPTLENLCLWVRDATEDILEVRTSCVTVSRPSLGERCVLRRIG